MIHIKDTITGQPSEIVNAIINDHDATLSLKLSKVETPGKIYEFNYPVLFQVYEEEGGTMIENELLNIYAAGATIAAAKMELSHQFGHSFDRLNELNDSQLSHKLFFFNNIF